MRRSRFVPAALKALTLVLVPGGCATGPNYVTPDKPPPVALSRTNEQPRWWPCMIGDALCKPQP